MAKRWDLVAAAGFAVAAIARAGPPEPVNGHFTFHQVQGFSFEDMKVIPEVRWIQDADVWFEFSAGVLPAPGGHASVTLAAAGGITRLADAVGTDMLAPRTARLFEAVLSADPGELHLGATATSDARTPEAEVFILRTRKGGWARLMVAQRGRTDPLRFGAGSEMWPVEVTYTFNPRESRFAPSTSDATRIGGLELAPAATPRGHLSPDVGKPGGVIPTAGARQEILLALSRDGAHGGAAYRSFARGARDAAPGESTECPPDLLYGARGDSIAVRPRGVDGSTIDDLGEAAWEAVPPLASKPWGGVPNAVASLGHVYRVLLADAVDPTPVLLRVTGLAPGERMAFEWVSLDAGVLRTSPGFAPPKEVRDDLEAALHAAATSYRGGFVGIVPADGQARSAWKGLAEPGGSLSVGPITLQSLLKSRAFARFFVEVDPAVREAVENVKVFFDSRASPSWVHERAKVLGGGSASDFGEDPTPFARLFDTTTRQAGVAWTLTETGEVRIVPIPAGK